MPSKTTAETVVIGAGLGGLAAACDLAAAGRDVLVLERHSLPGGFATSFSRGRFEFETSLHEVADADGIAYLRSLLPDLELLNVPEAYRVILTQKGVDFTAPIGKGAFTDALVEAVPEGAESIRRFMGLCEEIYCAFNYLGTVSPPSLRTLFGTYGNFIRTGAATLDEVADSLALPQKARDLIYPYWCYLGVPAEKVSFSIWATMLYGNIGKGTVIPRYRSHGISVAMADYITRHGGRIRYNTEACRLVHTGRRITGVTLADGETIETDNVIANVSPHRLFTSLLQGKRRPRRLMRTINARRPGISFFVLYLGLDASAEELGIGEYSWFIAPHMNTGDLTKKMNHRLDPDPMQAAVCLNVADPDASPPGTAILSITICCQPDAWAGVAPEDYPAEKSRLAEIAVNQFETATGIAIRDHIEEMEMAAPPTFARYTGAWDGRVYGYEPVPWDGIIPRFVSGKREKMFRNLQFCGGNAELSMGYSSSLASGSLAAKRTMEGIGR